LGDLLSHIMEFRKSIYYIDFLLKNENPNSIEDYYLLWMTKYSYVNNFLNRRWDLKLEDYRISKYNDYSIKEDLSTDIRKAFWELDKSKQMKLLEETNKNKILPLNNILSDIDSQIILDYNTEYILDKNTIVEEFNKYFIKTIWGIFLIRKLFTNQSLKVKYKQ